MLKKIKAKWEQFISNLADSNKTNYGDGGINCCELKDANEAKKIFPKKHN